MPIYEYGCPACEEEWEAFHSIDTRKEEYCVICERQANLLISAGARPIIEDYYSESLGAVVTGPKHRKELMRAKGLEER